MGTLRPVRSGSALRFADAFFGELPWERRPLGLVSLRAKQAIREAGGDPTWLSYAVYGSPAATASELRR